MNASNDFTKLILILTLYWKIKMTLIWDINEKIIITLKNQCDIYFEKFFSLKIDPYFITD